MQNSAYYDGNRCINARYNTKAAEQICPTATVDYVSVILRRERVLLQWDVNDIPNR